MALHKQLVASCLRGPLNVITTIPIGRFLNGFSNDMATADFVLPFTCRSIINCVAGLIFTVIVIASHLPWFLVVLITLVPIYLAVQVSIGFTRTGLIAA
jgi:hypothetical protein